MQRSFQQGWSPAKPTTRTWWYTQSPNDGAFSVLVEGLAAKTARLLLVDMTGRTVLEQYVITTPADIPVSADLAPGAYFVQLTTADHTLSQRIVVR